MESATKYLSGHSDVMAGVVVGSRERIAAVRSAPIDTGATLGPFAAFLVLRGIPTLAVRMERQARTALALATFLERQEGVNGVIYPGLPSHPQADAAARILDGGGAMLPSTSPAAARPGACSSTRSRSRSGPRASGPSTRWSSTRRPAATARSTPQLAPAGITEGLLRVSVGLEDEADLLADVRAALRAARAATAAASPA